ncbi:MAG: methyltransferase domain-containing protein [Isosphaeraceae bacterium]|nr:methyltransferase domain-containing protein [Isosphaeraceae bacterium]
MLKHTMTLPARYLWRGTRRVLPRPVRRRGREVLDLALEATARVQKLRRKTWARQRLTEGIEPLSYLWGGDRGVPIYYYYVLQFLAEYASDIRGHCLEFQEDAYASRFGGKNITKLDILHLDDTNPRATLVGDLTKPNPIPSHCFDCIICTHVLHVIFDLERAVADLYRILSPGGVLLVAVPLVSMDGPEWHELWRFTTEGLQRLLSRVFGAEQVLVRAYGNSLTAAGQLRGLVADEFTQEELDYQDPRFAVEICARAIKSG